MSRPEDQAKRDKLRLTTVGLTKNNSNPKFQHAFVVGGPALASTQRLLLEENSKHGDIIQQSFIESYFNLTLKTLAALEWGTTFCPGAKWIMKVDDDVYVNMDQLTEVTRKKANTDTVLCSKIFMSMAKRASGHPSGLKKFFLTTEEYPYYFFPSYCSGPMYIMSQSVARYIVHVSPDRPFLKFEDVYLGLCLARSPYSITHIPNIDDVFHDVDSLWTMDCDQLHNYVYIHSVPFELLEQLWKRCENDRIHYSDVT